MELQIRWTASPTTENDVINAIELFHTTFLTKNQWGDKEQLCENSMLKAKKDGSNTSFFRSLLIKFYNVWRNEHIIWNLS